ncbi:MAG: FecR domain-containing protein [Treponema sp.]|nr:FecR domain-containing protein [Treponema sp.]
MKKYFILVCVFAFCLSSVIAMDATVLSVKGKAEVQTLGKWVPLAIGNKLQQGSVIQTGFKSELILKIKNTTVTVSPLSRITLEQLVSKSSSDDTKIFLDAGSLKSNVKRTEDRRVGFTVRSPVATASVRGTVLNVKNLYKSTQVTCSEGKVAVWKSKNVKANISEDVEDSSESSFDKPQPGMCFVTKGQSSEIKKRGSIAPKNNAHKNSSSIKNIRTDIENKISKPIHGSLKVEIVIPEVEVVIPAS